MAFSDQPPAAPPSFGSAASQVFGVPELVSLIIGVLTQPQLAKLMTLNWVTLSECERVLYRSPWVDEIGPGNRPINGLARALTGQQRKHLRDLGLGFKPYERPYRAPLERLFTACSPLAELELAGKSGGIEGDRVWQSG